MKLGWIYSLLFVFCLKAMTAQHYQFSQFYAASTYLNPAFTGANVCSRLSINYRNQWSGVQGTYVSSQIAFDHYLKSIKSGIGLQFFSDKAGLGSLKTTQFAALYAYEIMLSKKIMARAGVSIGGIQRSVDYNTFIFGDQIARGGASSSVETFGTGRVIYLDIGAGALVYSANTWVGFSASHINNPNQSLMDGTSPLPPEFKLHGGYKLIIEESQSASKKFSDNNSVTFTFNYKHQRNFNQLDIGLYYSRSVMVVGLWYRGIPLYKPMSYYSSNDALVLLLGLSLDKFRIGYSYDCTISKLTNISSLGTHELSASFQFCNPKKKKKKKNILISCPKF